MSEKRHYKRFLLEGQYVVGRMNFTTEVSLSDISLGGASITTDRRLHVGEKYNCRIQDGRQVMSVMGTVVWEEPLPEGSEAEGSHSVGICFNKVFTGKGDSLAGLIEHWARSEHQRHRVRGVRIKLHGADAELDHFGQYRVDEVSFGGMRMESALKMDKGSELDIKMSIPNAMRPVKVRARVASCRKINSTQPEMYKVGVEFLDMSLGDLSRLKELIYSL